MKNIWQKLNKPIIALAPLAGVADSAFRQICKDFGADVVYSEMASATALCYTPKKTLKLIEFNIKERPYIIQLFGSIPEDFQKAVSELENYRTKEPKNNFDGYDINFGCPVPKVAKQKAGAELFKDLKRSREVIKAVIASTDLPVSIKTRTQAGDIDIHQFLDYMSDLDIKAIMIHGRTLKQGFSGPIDTKIIKNARNYFGGIILANGGIENREDALRILEETGADGVGIGRGALGRPWIFSEIKKNNIRIGTRFIASKNVEAPRLGGTPQREIFKVALKHAKLVNKLKGDVGIREMRKHLCWYVQGLPNARELRNKLVKVNTLQDIIELLAVK